jgi:hypothetical protein
MSEAKLLIPFKTKINEQCCRRDMHAPFLCFIAGSFLNTVASTFGQEGWRNRYSGDKRSFLKEHGSKDPTASFIFNTPGDQ